MIKALGFISILHVHKEACTKVPWEFFHHANFWHPTTFVANWGIEAKSDLKCQTLPLLWQYRLWSFQGRDTKSTVVKWNYQIRRIGVVSSCQKVPKLDFQSQFSMSKIIRNLSNVFFIKVYEFRSSLFVIDIFL